jgi:hypothetical protein
MIGLWLMGEMLLRRSPWILPNLLATTFYGEGAYRAGFMASTWSGLAGPMVVYCAAGVVFALAARERMAGWNLVMVGAVAGVALDWLIFGVALKRMNPLVQIYSPDHLITISHVVYGMALASYPGFAKKLLPAAEPPPIPMDPTEVPEIDRSGPSTSGGEMSGAGTSGADASGSDQEVGRSIP